MDLNERTVTGLLRSAVACFGERRFLNFSGRVWTFREVDRNACQIANMLASLGMRPGQKLAIMLANSPEFLFVWFGAAKLNVVVVPINIEYRGEILTDQLSRADVAAIVIGGEFLGRLADVGNELPKIRHVLVSGAPLAAELPAFMARQPLARASEFPVQFTDRPIRYHDLLFISFTSGTTGLSKGVPVTHCHVVTFALDWIKSCTATGSDRTYSGMPMFHLIGSWLTFVPPLILGIEVLLVEKFSASRFWDDVRNFKATIAQGIFSMIPILLKQPAREDDARIALRTFYVGQRNEEFERRFNCWIVEAYGGTETGVVTMTPHDEPGRPGSCGRVNSENFEVKLLDDDGNACPPGKVGEFVIRGRHPALMAREYYGMPEATAATFREGWFHSGDQGRMDSDGFFYFVDRKKDAIRRRGENISSFEVERALNTHPQILESAAVAVPSELGEDDVKVFVTVRAGERVTAEELWSFCEARMPRFWVPRYIEFLEEMPKTPSQKIQKALLRDGRCKGALYSRPGAGSPPYN